MQVKYKGTQYVHKFTKGEEVKYVACSNEEFEKITEKPSLEGFDYQYTVGGMVEVDTPSKLLGEEETTVVEGKIIIRQYEKDGEVITEYENNQK